MRLDPEILDGPPETGARVVALARLADAEDAVGRLEERPDDAAALREFRVALRRLAAALAAVAPALAGAVPQQRMEQLGALARRAGPAGGTELHGPWLHAVRGELPAPHRGALDWLLDRVERRRRAGDALAAGAASRFGRIAPRLHRDLMDRCGAAARPGASASFAVLLAAALRAQTRALREAILALAGPGDAAGLHRVRTEGKRLRHLLEPLRASDVRAGEALDALRPLQDLLGDWRDAVAAGAALEAALLEARVEQARRDEAALAGLRPGLLAILRLAQTRAADLAARIADGHLADNATAVTDAAYAVAAALEARSGGSGEDQAGPPPFPERRFLVTAVPPEGRGDVEEHEQGWLPGSGVESVGVTRSARGERCFRAHAPARGRPSRIEPISRAEFEAFWPLTEGRRIAKRRHLPAHGPGWRIDEYVDRPLVLAVAEEGNAGEPPPWLEPTLVREVSAERGYLDEALARRPPRRSG